MIYIWIFSGNTTNLPSGVFSSLDEASKWIKENNLSGTICRYPIGMGLLDWAIYEGVISSRKEGFESDAIANFTCASIKHYHCKNGVVYV